MERLFRFIQINQQFSLFNLIINGDLFAFVSTILCINVFLTLRFSVVICLQLSYVVWNLLWDQVELSTRRIEDWCAHSARTHNRIRPSTSMQIPTVAKSNKVLFCEPFKYAAGVNDWFLIKLYLIACLASGLWTVCNFLQYLLLDFCLLLLFFICFLF